MEMRDILKEQQGTVTKSYVGQLIQKWNPMLKGVRNDYTRGVMSVLYENQASYLMSLTEETRTSNVGEFMKYIFPVLRRVNVVNA